MKISFENIRSKNPPKFNRSCKYFWVNRKNQDKSITIQPRQKYNHCYNYTLQTFNRNDWAFEQV